MTENERLYRGTSRVGKTGQAAWTAPGMTECPACTLPTYYDVNTCVLCKGTHALEAQ